MRRNLTQGSNGGYQWSAISREFQAGEMRLSRAVEYAVQAVLILAESGSKGPVACSRLAEAGRMPERFLLQVLRNLVKHGILESTRGIEGGYRLRRPLTEVSLLEVIEAVDGPMTLPVSLNGEISGNLRQQLSDALREITTVSRRQLRSIKLASLLEEQGAAPKPRE